MNQEIVTTFVRIRRIDEERHVVYGVVRPFPGADGYYVSAEWIVLSCRPLNGRGGLVPLCEARELRKQVAPNGYEAVTICSGDWKISKSVHVAVCRAFHGEAPTEAHEVRHRDGKRGNNRAANLRWATHVENCADRKIHGTHLEGCAHPQSRLTPSDVALIHTLRADHHSLATIARHIGVSKALVHLVSTGVRYAR